jgi:hypothetical protein
MRTSRVCLAGCLALALVGAGCRKQQQPPPPAAAPAVATFDGGRITAADVDRAVLDLPPQQRQPADGDLLGWYERIARDLAVQAVLVAEARQAGLDRGPDFEPARAEARRHAVVSVFLDGLPPAEPPAPKEIEAHYRAHAKDFTSPTARQTYHLFRRVAPGADPAPVVAEVRRFRQRVVAGEDFAKIASEHSESESRHQKGLLGWVRRGQVSADLERVIFSLELKVPSEPLKTREGVHLFLVSAESPGKTLTLTEVRGAIVRRLAAEHREAEIDRQLAAAPVEGSVIPTTEELKGLFAAGDPGAVVLRVADFQVTLGQLQQRILAGQVGVTTGADDTPAHALVVALDRRERIYQLCVRRGVDRSPEAEARLQRLIDRELAGLQIRKRLVERIEREPRRLEDYYQANRSRFSTPLRLRVQRLSVPLKGDANQVMARLERARAELDERRLDFARLAAEVGGTLLEPAWEVPTQLAEREKRPSSPVAALKPGRHSAPYRTTDHIEMVRVMERAEPQVQPLDKVRDRVLADLLVTHRHDEYAALVETVLAGRGYQVVRSELEAMLKRPAPKAG